MRIEIAADSAIEAATFDSGSWPGGKSLPVQLGHAVLLARDGPDLPVGRDALQDFAYSVLKKSQHAALNRFDQHGGRASPRLNELLDLLRSDQQLMERHSSFES
jgi:hypothetical protein